MFSRTNSDVPREGDGHRKSSAPRDRRGGDYGSVSRRARTAILQPSLPVRRVRRCASRNDHREIAAG